MSVEIHDPKGSPKIDTEAAVSNLFNLGFRPFFLLAGIFAVATMTLWLFIYSGLLGFDSGPLTLFQWHGHEMIFGYAAAVIAGFLLTSVKNWTGQQTPIGNKLALMVGAWVVARIAFAVGGELVSVGVLFNLFFFATFLYSIGSRIFRVRQWKQAGIIVVVFLLTLGELLFVYGLLERNQWLTSKVIYAGFYLVVMLILIMGRRVLPFFTERGVGYEVRLRQSSFLDIAVIASFAGYAIVQVAGLSSYLGAGLAAIAFTTHTLRLLFWHTPGIWKKPLLWSLYGAMAFLSMGFLLAALSPFLSLSSYLVLHAFSVGGIGLVTLSMMSRVALGHTGRDIHRAPFVVKVALFCLVVATLVRVFFPLFWSEHYLFWIITAQVFWISAFVLFVIQYSPLLFRPREDGQPG